MTHTFGFELADGNDGPSADGVLHGSLQVGKLEARLALSLEDVKAVQALRYRVFYDEGCAVPSIEMAREKRDFDAFDQSCDHLMVIDHGLGSDVDSVVGTYRLRRRTAADAHGGFYSAGEYDIAPLQRFRGEILELGRSCVASSHRTRAVIELLWRGIAAYMFRHRIGLMFGCASLPGTDPDALKLPLSYLYHHHLAPPEHRPRALKHLHQNMNMLPRGSFDVRDARAQLPPLFKGYLRLGGYVGDGAVVDHQFQSTDVCVVLMTDRMTQRYARHYERRAGQSDAA
ncbi:MAG: GNAT family N-acyltransferase [Alphaproteobacteria bacterium]|nr:GNAT family N-acyltransferase [Alphaproteobacteria bacterium]